MTLSALCVRQLTKAGCNGLPFILVAAGQDITCIAWGNWFSLPSFLPLVFSEGLEMEQGMHRVVLFESCLSWLTVLHCVAIAPE